MSDTSRTTPPRRPRVFAADDPELTIDRGPAIAPEEAAAGKLGETAPPRIGLPSLDDIGRGIRWGSILASALAAAASVAIALWYARLVAIAFDRDDLIGWFVRSLLVIAAIAFVVLLVREVIGFSRLARMGRLKRKLAEIAKTPDAKTERAAIDDLTALYSGRRELGWHLARLAEHRKDVRDAGELVALADRDLMAPLDGEARRLITRTAKRVATVTALSPMMFIAVGYVMIANVGLLRRLATLYGGRPGVVGALRLGRMVVTHLIATGGVALTDDLLGQFVAQDALRRVSTRLGEGAFNGALTARVGVAAIEVLRPLPYVTATPVRVRDILAEVLRRPIEKSVPKTQTAGGNQ
jgi:putative membrane protein